MCSLKDGRIDRSPIDVAFLSLAVAGLVMLAALFPFLNALPCFAQGQFGERLRQRIQSRQRNQQGLSRGDVTNMQATSLVTAIDASTCKVAGLELAVWQPKASGTLPLVIFSHGFHGRNTQSEFLMRALAQAGYLVVAPNHKDALGAHALALHAEENSEAVSLHEITGEASEQRIEPGFSRRSQESFRQPLNWSEATYRNRRDDIAKLFSALRTDSRFEALIDWNRIALVGHSLGGYTVLGLAGAWPSWKLPGIKAVIAMSPYCQPYLAGGNLSSLDVPVMYQGGTRDFGITPFVKNAGGAFAKTGAPACFVEFDKMGHLGWTSFNRDTAQRDLIEQYCLAFLDQYLKDKSSAVLKTKVSGVSDLRSK